MPSSKGRLRGKKGEALAHSRLFVRARFLLLLSAFPDTRHWLGVGLGILSPWDTPLSPVQSLPCPLCPVASSLCPSGFPHPQFWMLILATTIPMPAGYFMPIFIFGESGVLMVSEVQVIGAGLWLLVCPLPPQDGTEVGPQGWRAVGAGSAQLPVLTPSL